ncbi:hypothetical protein ONS95_002990 [Cadophora gregata]|uniref:uncharacterized protein n=1 Tax=Cadophora gregata TaxID=51156 RepID=UPI0026DBA954|nr:uncharacterized protein ONS95_002990 [Cadophora gregata]KAK0108168.1 hypothetical protein ONS95_002990 [Cadophora gregata]KAK0109239.1 hypothetical protein ONS96_003061 [Cadophora gregata f. sp. sojae]
MSVFVVCVLVRSILSKLSILFPAITKVYETFPKGHQLFFSRGHARKYVLSYIFTVSLAINSRLTCLGNLLQFLWCFLRNTFVTLSLSEASLYLYPVFAPLNYMHLIAEDHPLQIHCTAPIDLSSPIPYIELLHPTLRISSRSSSDFFSSPLLILPPIPSQIYQ